MQKPQLKLAIHARLPALGAALAVLACPLVANAAAVWTTNATVKVRPTDPPGAGTSVHLSAARNEFEPFQVVVQGAATGVQATASDLVGPGTIPASQISLYREALYNAINPSGPDGATGRWPDGLVPDVDGFVHEKRNAFPFDVPAGEERAIWVDVLVPADAPPGTYTGKVTVLGSGIANGSVDVPVSLTVHRFTLPSTPSLKTAFGMWWAGPCLALYGDASCGGDDAKLEQVRTLFVEAALDDRISIEGAVYHGPSNSDWSHFDSVYGPLLDGTAPTRLAGAKLTEVRYQASRDPATASNWAQHFRQKGWFSQLFDYTCDEPPLTCAWSDIPARAAVMHGADPGFRTLVTTTLGEANANGVAADVSVMVPVVNMLEPKGAASTRPAYDSYIQSGNEVWQYQSCMSHGCGGAFGAAAGSVGTTDPAWGGWPTYAVDSTAIRNRAEEWLSFKDGVTGELYYETMMHSDSAWTDQFDFGGNGDGTLFYAGRPADIGGTTPIPVDSIRLKLIREGIEDYEYLKMLSDLGEGDWARQQAAALFPSAGDTGSTSPEELYAVREAVAQRIDAHLAPPDGSSGSTGSTSSSGSAATGSTGSGASTGSIVTGGSTGGPVLGTDTGSTGATGATGSTGTDPSKPANASGGCGAAGDGLGLSALLASLGALALRRRRHG